MSKVLGVNGLPKGRLIGVEIFGIPVWKTLHLQSGERTWSSSL